MAENRPLDGKVALVTGGSRGIGRGIAIRLAEKGATVAVNYIRDELAANETVERIDATGGKAFTVRADVSNPDEVMNMVKRTHDDSGALDIFVNNALGNLLGFLTPPSTVTLDQFDEAYACQARAFLVGAQSASGVLSDGGRIVALSYWPGSHLGGFLPYFALGANKAAMEAMCRDPTTGGRWSSFSTSPMRDTRSTSPG